MLKHIIGYGACALIVFLSLNSWHSKDKQVNALTKDLSTAYSVIKQKDEDKAREEEAIAERDKKYERLDKKLDAVQRNLRNLASSSQELRDILNMRIPPALLRELHTYNSELETNGSETPVTKAGDRK